MLDNTGRFDETLLFSFQGLAGPFAAFAFDTLRSAGLNAPPEPERYAVGTIPGGTNPPEPERVFGVIVAYDAPVVVGTWDVTVTAVPEPETYAMLLAGLGLLGFVARRRKQQEAAAA